MTLQRLSHHAPNEPAKKYHDGAPPRWVARRSSRAVTLVMRYLIIMISPSFESESTGRSFTSPCLPSLQACNVGSVPQRRDPYAQIGRLTADTRPYECKLACCHHAQSNTKRERGGRGGSKRRNLVSALSPEGEGGKGGDWPARS